MKALILSCSTGGGHNSAGLAVAQELRKQGHSADIINLSSLTSPTSSDISKDFYVFVVKHAPYLFGAVYYIAKAISNSKVKSPVYLFNMIGCKRLIEFIQKNNYDIILTPHLYCGQKLTHLKRKGRLNIPFIFIFTDYTCIPFSEDIESDYYIIPHKDCLSECIKRGMPADKLIPSGIPVQEDYKIKTDKPKARKMLGLPENDTVFLIMSGSMGFGNITGFVKKLYQKCTGQEHIVIICGTDKAAFQKLSNIYSSSPNVHIEGYTDKVALYMDACDVIFSKPGGLSSTEAAAKRIPLIHASRIPGCETANMQFFKERGMSLTGRTQNAQIKAGIRLAGDKQVREDMIKAQKENINPESANSIYQAVLQLLNGSDEDK